LIEQQEASGSSVRQFCRKQGVSEPSFYWWRKRLRNSEPVRFALVDTRGLGAQTTAHDWPLELELVNGERLRIGAGVNGATLRAVLEVVRS
jgi:hypothetical protein